MIADGVIKGVHIKVNCPVDRLLQMYYACQINSDMIAIYAAAVPSGKEKIAMLGDVIKAKYPFIDNRENARLDEIDKYNRSMQLAKKLIKAERGNKRG